jgi:hypothetical protein
MVHPVFTTIVSLIIVVVMTSPIWLTMMILFWELNVLVAFKVLVGLISMGFGIHYLSKIVDIVDD